MERKISLTTFVIAFIAIFIFLNSLYIVDQQKQALVFQFGEVVKVNKEPGLHFKIPVIQKVEFFDNRILNAYVDEKEVIAKDRKRLLVNAYAKYKITDPLKFYQTLRDDHLVKSRLNPIFESSLREALGKVPLVALLTDERVGIMRQIKELVNVQVSNFGIDIVDVRILRADLPKENSAAIYRRMQTDREKEAKESRAEGAEEAQRVKSHAEKDRKVIIAEAQKQGDIIRGEGEAISAKIYADSYGKDNEFFAFYRSLQSYRLIFDKENTKLILSPNSELLKYFSSLDR